MSWMSEHSLQRHITGPGIPLVLCGPLLRRAEPASVSVFVAFKYARDVTLQVFVRGGSSPLMRGTARTVALGEFLHVAVVTATPVGSGSGLTGGVVYSYDLEFTRTPSPHPTDTVSTTQNLEDLGLLEHPAMLGFEPRELPGFALPPADMNRLRIIHASCRKPHGESLDALEGLEMMIRETRDEALGRPHQLFLGGDQIYADDVADALLFTLMDANDTLLGWSELGVRREADGRFKDEGMVVPRGLPGTTIKAMDLLAGRRSPTTRNLCGFTVHPKKNKKVGTDRSHLLAFGEFAAMYLFAWSKELWPPTLPDFNDVYPEKKKTFLRPRRGDGLIAVDTKEYKTYKGQTDLLEQFKDRLEKVRRALANVPTYMIFDDHEITDDWFINRRWCRQVLGASLGRRAIQNGLAAFAVFQAWGNTPDRFSSGQVGRALLDNLTVWSDLERRFADGEVGGDAGTVARTQINNLVGIPVDLLNRVRNQGNLDHVPGTMDWHYHITGPNHEVIVLDTRTWRAYSEGETAPANLISDTGLGRQIADLGPSQAEVTMVVSAVPVVGVPVVEKIQHFAFTDKLRFKCDVEAWALQEHPSTYLLSKLAQRLPRENALAKRRGYVVLLSGDVHHGFAARFQYWARNVYEPGKAFGEPGDGAEMVAVQFTSSALKNEDSLTGALHRFGYMVGDFLPKTEVAGWNNKKRGRHPVGTYGIDPGGTLKTWGNPALIDVNPTRPIRLFNPPHWKFRIDYLLAETEVTRPVLPVPIEFTPLFVPVPPPDEGHGEERRAALGAYLAMSSNHEDYTEVWGHGKEIVGVNNIGEINFIWGAENERAVVQNLWWRLKRAGNPDLFLTAFPLTKHIAPLRFDHPDYPEPVKERDQ